MLSSETLSMMDHTNGAEDMQYIIQPRGPGTGWVFRMVTPTELVGKPNPWTGKPFGKEIRKGLSTRRLPDARRQRDVILGEIRKLTFAQTDEANFGVEEAQAIRQQLASTDDPDGLMWALDERVQRGAQRGVPVSKLRRYNQVALGKGFPLDKALEQYVQERSPDNRRGYKPLSQTTVNNLRTAVRHLRNFLGDTEEIACLEDVTSTRAAAFRNEYLPSLTSNRSPHGMAFKTVEKNITLLRQLWSWARERKISRDRYGDPWSFTSAVPRKSRDRAQSR